MCTSEGLLSAKSMAMRLRVSTVVDYMNIAIKCYTVSVCNLTKISGYHVSVVYYFADTDGFFLLLKNKIKRMIKVPKRII